MILNLKGLISALKKATPDELAEIEAVLSGTDADTEPSASASDDQPPTPEILPNDPAESTPPADTGEPAVAEDKTLETETDDKKSEDNKESEDIGAALKARVDALEAENKELSDALEKYKAKYEAGFGDVKPSNSFGTNVAKIQPSNYAILAAEAFGAKK